MTAAAAVSSLTSQCGPATEQYPPAAVDITVTVVDGSTIDVVVFVVAAFSVATQPRRRCRRVATTGCA